jgi:hypothetical protein
MFDGFELLPIALSYLFGTVQDRIVGTHATRAVHDVGR